MDTEELKLITREFYDLPVMPGLYAVRYREYGLLIPFPTGLALYDCKRSIVSRLLSSAGF